MREKNNNEGQTIIGPSVKVKGDFNGDGDVIIEGEFVGSVKTKHNLSVGPNAVIEADIEAENAQIAGKIKGNIKVSGSLELAKSSRIDGDIFCQNLNIESGAILNGRCSMSEKSHEETNE